MADLQTQISSLLEKVPQSQRQAAASLLTQYGPRFFALAQADAWAYLRRLMAGDLDVVCELDTLLSDEEFISKVKINTARWENITAASKVRDSLKTEFLIRLAPVVLGLLLALVSL